jgi:PAS domain S-box-containing protein
MTNAIASILAILILGLLVQRFNRGRRERALRESERRFQLMADTAPLMVWMSGPDKLCTYCNKLWLDFTGRSLQDQLGDGWSKSVHPDDLQGCMDTYFRAFDARQEFRMEYRLRRFDGEYRWILDTGVPRLDSDGNFEGYIGSCIDVSDQKQIEETLRESQSELRVLTGRLLQAQEMERRRIARELHDDLNQNLSLLSVEMDLLGQKPPESATQLAERMQELSARVRQVSSSVHDLSHQLHPSILEQLGLIAAVRGLCKEWSGSHGMPIEFVARHAIPSIPEDIALCLYRIVQEALRNVTKHSSAHRATVELSSDSEAIELLIIDDGSGFDPALVDGRDGLGLISMRERLRLVKGEISIESRPSAGTRIQVRVPLPETNPADDTLPRSKPREMSPA